MTTKKHQNVEAFLRNSDYFRRYILTDWMRRNPQAAEEMIRKVREDSVAEEEIQYHLKKVEGQ